MVVIGAGVVGLACAAALARAGHPVVVVERLTGLGREITSRNSQVLHAGLYYPTGSWKARCAWRAARCSTRAARARGSRTGARGKLVVAVEPAELAVLERLHALGTENGAPGLELVDARSPCAASSRPCGPTPALLSPDSGIVDAHALCLSFAAEAEAHGAAIALGREVTAIERRRDRLSDRGAERERRAGVARGDGGRERGRARERSRRRARRTSTSTRAGCVCTRARGTTSRSRPAHRCASSASSTRSRPVRVSACT